MATLPEPVPENEQSPPETTETAVSESRLKQLGEILAGTLQKDKLDDKGIKPH